MLAHHEFSSHSPAGGETVINPILNEIRRQLQASPYVAIKKLRCEFHEGAATLRGSVPTFRTRQVALAVVQQIAGVAQVEDRITVDEAAADTTNLLRSQRCRRRSSVLAKEDIVATSDK